MCPQCRLPLKARDCPGVVAAPRRHRRIVPGRMRGPEICPRLCKHHHHHQQLKGIYVCFNGWELTEEEGHDGSLHDGLSTPVCGERWSIIRSLVWVSSVRAQPLTMEQGGDAAWQHTRRCWMWPASFLCDAVNSSVPHILQSSIHCTSFTPIPISIKSQATRSTYYVGKASDLWS